MDHTPLERAQQLVLHLGDLVGPGWRSTDLGDDPDEELGALLLDACLGEDIVESAIAAAAASPLFVQPPNAFVYSIAAVFGAGDDAQLAAERVGSSDFARCFAEAIATEVAVEPLGHELLDVRPAPLTIARSRGLADRITVSSHRAVFTGGSKAGLLEVTVDFASLRCGRAVVLSWFGDAPTAFDDESRDATVERLADRLSELAPD